jgi:glycosyltransferase involved in cell wall biosynthesis
MKIAQIAPLIESVPPKLYGGTERVVSYLTEELVRCGHEVVLFASGDSKTSAQLVACSEQAIRLGSTKTDGLPFHLMMLDAVRECAADFDILHFHTDLLHFPMFRDMANRTVSTVHGRLDLSGFRLFFERFRAMPLVSISNQQRQALSPNANWLGTVYHGLPKDLLPFQGKPAGDYIAFLGRISPEKRPDRAIEISAKIGISLKIAAKIDPADRDYWESVIEPLCRANKTVEFIGEVDEKQKRDFLGNARAVLFPVDWPEPFGLVMIEAMACGTPVIAFNCGSVPEVVDDGVTGLIVKDIEEAVHAIEKAHTLDRALIRSTFERRFSAESMAREYLRIYGAQECSRETLRGPETQSDAAVPGQALVQ